MVKGKPYVHWKIKDETDLTDVDPTYLWGTVVETDKGPIDEPVIIKSVEQGKRIFNYDFSPFFANGGRYIVVVRAYGKDTSNMPAQAEFSIVNDKDIEYLTVEYVWYKDENGKKINEKSQAVIYIKEDTIESDEPVAANANEEIPEGFVEQYVAFDAGRWRFTSSDEHSIYYGKAIHYYYADITQSDRTKSIISAETYKEAYQGLENATAALENATAELEAKETELETTYANAESEYNSAAAAYDDAVAAYEAAEEADKAEAQTAVEAALETKTAAYNKYSVLKNIQDAITAAQANVDTYTTLTGKYKVLEAACFPDADGEEKYYYNGTERTDANPANELEFTFTKAFNQSLVKQLKHTVRGVIEKGAELVNLKTKYPGNFEIPIAVNLDKRGVGYRISIQESSEYTLLLSGANTPKYITSRINERAENVVATTTKAGETLNSLLLGNLEYPPIGEDGKYCLFLDETVTPNVDNSALYDEKAMTLPVDSVFAPISEDRTDVESFEMRLSEIQDYFSEGSNGPWDEAEFRIPSTKRVAAHENALSYLSNVKLAGIFCLYGENKVQQAYVDHVSTTEPTGMNSEEVCKWRQLIIGANAYDRSPDSGIRMEERALPLYDKAIAADNQYIIYLGQGLIDDGYIPETRASELGGDEDAILTRVNFEGGKDYQLLPYQCVQYVAGLRSSLFYGASIFGGQEIKKIRGVGNMEIAPLFSDEDKVIWQPDTYALLNEYGVLTFTNEYGQISLTDGVTTRQDPLQEDEEGVVSIVKYAQHKVHEVLLQYIGRNITGDLQTGMEVEVRNVLNNMYSTDKTLIDLPEEGYSAFDVQIVLAPKSNTQQLLSKVYVYLKLTPVHALRQIEVELTVQ